MNEPNSLDFIVIIPARFASIRLPGKPLADINGKPMVVRVMELAQTAGANLVIVATDHQGVVESVERAGGKVCLTSTDHQSGTERLHEVIDRYGFHDDQIIVNVQGDEPLIPSQIIHQVANNLARVDASIATLAVPITTVDEAYDSNVVKVVLDAQGYALYFSRAAIPWNRERSAHCRKFFSHGFLRHIGIYAYRAGFIRRYVNWTVSPLENIEFLEQLRVLWHGEKIYVAVVNNVFSISVDTPKELEQVRLLQQQLGNSI